MDASLFQPIAIPDDADTYRPSEDEIAAFYTSPDWYRLAYEIKVAYGRQCQCCGGRPEDGIRIVSDHIKPIRYYWHLRLTASNIGVLCDACNLGKGSRYEHDFRAEPVAPEGVMKSIKEKMGWLCLGGKCAEAKALVTDAYSFGEISEKQGKYLITQFNLGGE